MAAKSRKQKPESGVVRTRDEAAAALGVSLRTLAAWMKLPGFPGHAGDPFKGNGHFPVPEIRAWNQARGGTAGGEEKSNSALAERKAQAEVAKAEEDARFKRLRNEEKQSRLVERDIVETNAAELCLRIKDRLEQIPEELALIVPAKYRRAVQEETAERIHMILLEMSQWEPMEG